MELDLTHELQRLAHRLREHPAEMLLLENTAVRILTLEKRNTELETEMTRVGKIAAAAIAKLANVPAPTDPSLVIDADDVAQLSTLATDAGVDPTTGDPVTPAASNTASVAPAVQ